jgi:hypothetical protein
VRGYLGVGIAVGALLAGAAVAAGLGVLPRRPLALALAALFAAGALTRFPGGSQYPGLRHAAAADLTLGRQLAELPPRAALLTAHVESAFVVGYQRLVEGRRPDVAWAHLGFARGPGYARRLADAEPDLAPLLRDPASALVVAALDRRRPVRLEADEHVDPGLRARLLPAGLTWRLASTDPRYDLPVVLPVLPPAAVAEAAADRQARGYLAWRAFNDGVLACQRGLVDAARENLQMLSALLPRDRLAVALAARCRPVIGIGSGPARPPGAGEMPGFLREDRL